MVSSEAPIWILSDAHAGAETPADEALLATIAAAGQEGADLLILGDLFTGWVGFPQFWTPFQRRVVSAMRALRRLARRIDFVEGNRDFFLESLVGDVIDRLFVGPTILPLGGQKTWVEHGDGLDESDLAYRTFRRLTKNRLTRALAARCPGSVGRAVVTNLEKTLKDTNRAYKSGSLPLAIVERRARLARARGAERVLLGHFHHERVLDVTGGVPVLLAPPWLSTRRVLVLSKAIAGGYFLRQN